jgi:hypothetical protein
MFGFFIATIVSPIFNRFAAPHLKRKDRRQDEAPLITDSDYFGFLASSTSVRTLVNIPSLAAAGLHSALSMAPASWGLFQDNAIEIAAESLDSLAAAVMITLIVVGGVLALTRFARKENSAHDRHRVALARTVLSRLWRLT